MKSFTQTLSSTLTLLQFSGKLVSTIVTDSCYRLQTKIKKALQHSYVIDASISGIAKLNQCLDYFCNQSRANLVLTDLTIKELHSINNPKIDGIHSVRGARRILRIASENPRTFKYVSIDPTLGSPDNCIIQYCVKHKKSVTLLTADKEMAALARMEGVRVFFFKRQMPFVINSKTFRIKSSEKSICDLPQVPVKKIGTNLMIEDFHTPTTSIRVYRNGIEFNNGPITLQKGDMILIATKKDIGISFACYQVNSLDSAENFDLVFSKFLYKPLNLSDLSALHKRFLKDFSLRHDL